MRCYGDFVCSKCGTISHKSFDVEKEEDAATLTITCPKCGREGVQTTIPTKMKAVCKQLCYKGYKIFTLNLATLCIVVTDRFAIDDPEDLPKEFVLDSTEEVGDIIVNGRLQANDFENDEQKNEYINEAVINLMNWIRTLPTIGKGEYINLDERKEEEG